MDLFCFACRNVRNIGIGIERQMWAVASLTNPQSRQARKTKAERYLHIGARGILYCNPTHSFTTPFIVQSRADQHAIVTNIWPEAWELPFRIHTLGDLSRQLHADRARERWPIVDQQWKSNGGISSAMNITGTTVFVPVSITEDDWALILHDLATTTD